MYSIAYDSLDISWKIKQTNILTAYHSLWIYRISKSALNSAVKSISYDLSKTNMIIVALHPGWVRTKSGGLSGLKAVAGLTGNLKGIKAAAGLPKQFIESGKLQSTIFKKVGKMLKNNKYESPSLEDASKSDKAFNPSED